MEREESRSTALLSMRRRRVTLALESREIQDLFGRRPDLAEKPVSGLAAARSHALQANKPQPEPRAAHTLDGDGDWDQPRVLFSRG